MSERCATRAVEHAYGRRVRHVYRKGLKTGDRFHCHTQKNCADLGKQKQGFLEVHLRLEHVCCRFGEQACALVDKTPVIHLEACLDKTSEKVKVLWLNMPNLPIYTVSCHIMQSPSV